MIKLTHVHWTYPHANQPALSDITLDIAPGELVVLCGASGSGKSTVLRLMNGLIPQFQDGALQGRVEVAGTVTSDVRLDQIGELVGTVLQHPRRQFFTDSVAEEIAFAMENLGRAPVEIRTRVTEALGRLAATVPSGVRLGQLSGGQQQQVGIAAACAHGPRILLLDEPSSNLSADAVSRLAASLRELKALGVTIVIAEHRLHYLAGSLDRVVVMRDGAVDVQWTAEQFAAISDHDLEREGLRGEVVSPALPEASSSGDLELDRVRCVLRGRTILDLEHVAFRRGEVTAIRGVNGAGKTTLTRIVAGLQRSTGSIRLDGRLISRTGRQRATAIVMQDVQRQLFTDSVEAEVMLALPDRVEGEETQVLADLDLAHLSSRHPLSLSGGQQQRLVIATARLSGRPVVIFDEPSSGVDRRHLRSISEQIRAVAARGAIVLLVSHDEDLLALAADCQITLPRSTSADVARNRPGRRATDAPAALA